MSVARFPGFVQLAFVGSLEGVASRLCRFVHHGCLQGIDHSNVKSGVLALGPVGEEHIGRFASLTWQQSPSLPGGTQAGSNGSVEKLVAEPIVACNPFTLPGAVHGMVAKSVTGLVAGKAWPIGGEYGVAEAVPHGSDKFWRFEQQP